MLIPRAEEPVTYHPEPVDTSTVELNQEMLALKETLAKNAHDVWAQRRIADGWRYGLRPDDVRKEHPLLVPYEQLAESEKAYHRDTALQGIKAILALGYKIEPPKTSEGPSNQRDLNTLQILGNPAALDLTSLLALWRDRSSGLWPETPEIYRVLGRQLLELGEPLLAYDVLSEGLKKWPEDIRLRQLLALSLARGGGTQHANDLLVELNREGHSDEETLAMLARTQKDLAIQAGDTAERHRRLALACEAYEQAYRLSGGYWAGINAATLSLLLGNRDYAVALASQVRDRCLERPRGAEKEEPDRYWPLATLGEAALILGRWSEAEDWYSRAAAMAHGRFADLSSTRRNARLILEHVDADRDRIERCLRIPRVVMFVGHMIDQPGRRPPRFAPQLEGAVQAAIRDRLKMLDAGFGYSSAACGSDVLFLEAMVELGGEAHVVLPYEKTLFLQDSVDIIAGANWGKRAERVLDQATEIVTVSGQKLTVGSVSYDYSNQVLHGLAAMHAGQLDTELVGLAVWNGEPGDGLGGTASTVDRWKALGCGIELINLNEMLRNDHPDVVVSRGRDRLSPSPSRAEQPSHEGRPEIMGIMFADVKGFSKLKEEETPRFVQHFLGLVGELADTFPHPPVLRNTWGDGLYFVFSSVVDAGEFAVELSERVKNTNWETKGLPKELSLRIGLHAGPVYPCMDTVTQRRNYIGTHITRAARIEPITPPNRVYGSQGFAALASMIEAKKFECDYVGLTALAKGFGTFPMYLVRRANA